MIDLLREATFWLAESLHLEAYEFRAYLAVLLVSVICGMVGSMVVGNRMAFFSDAMAHCAFAGVALGLIILLIIGDSLDNPLTDWRVPLIMVVFSATVGLGIAYVRQQTSLATDTVIGVFFAGAIGLGALLLTALKDRSRFNPEMFLFGSPLFVDDVNIFYLLLLALVTAGFLILRHNGLVFASVNTSLARSRGIPMHLDSYLFIVLLALVVNFSIVAVGVMLINGLLIVPAAAASNLARNMRQMFWMTMAISVGAGFTGMWVSLNVTIPIGSGRPLEPGPSGAILLTCVGVFFLSMGVPALGRLVRWRS